MEMTDSEIVKSYKRASNKKAQIEILAELNATTKDTIKAILKANDVDLRGGNYRSKQPEKVIEIEAADPQPGELGSEFPPTVEKPPLGIPPRGIAEALFSESRIKDIVEAMHRYYEAGMKIPLEWREELKDRL